MKELIIEHPESQSFQQKYTSLIFTILFWFIWFYIWSPLLVFAFSLMNVDIALFDSFSFVTFERFLQNLEDYMIYISVFCFIFIFWVSYNIFRFHSGSRYQEQKPTTIEELSDYAQLTIESLMDCKKAQVLTARFDANSQLIQLQSLSNS